MSLSSPSSSSNGVLSEEQTQGNETIELHNDENQDTKVQKIEKKDCDFEDGLEEEEGKEDNITSDPILSENAQKNQNNIDSSEVEHTMVEESKYTKDNSSNNDNIENTNAKKAERKEQNDEEEDEDNGSINEGDPSGSSPLLSGIRIWSGTWNLGCADPTSILRTQSPENVDNKAKEFATEIASYLFPNDQVYDIYFLGLQEAVNDNLYNYVAQMLGTYGIVRVNINDTVHINHTINGALIERMNMNERQEREGVFEMKEGREGEESRNKGSTPISHSSLVSDPSDAYDAYKKVNKESHRTNTNSGDLDDLLDFGKDIEKFGATLIDTFGLNSLNVLETNAYNSGGSNSTTPLENEMKRKYLAYERKMGLTQGQSLTGETLSYYNVPITEEISYGNNAQNPYGLPVTSSSPSNIGGRVVDKLYGRGDGSIFVPKFTGVAMYIHERLQNHIRILKAAVHGVAGLTSKGGVAIALKIFNAPTSVYFEQSQLSQEYGRNNSTTTTEEEENKKHNPEAEDQEKLTKEEEYLNEPTSSTSLVFVTSHLEAKKNDLRREQMRTLEVKLGEKLGERGLDLTEQFHHIIWSGDLNYRCIRVKPTIKTMNKKQTINQNERKDDTEDNKDDENDGVQKQLSSILSSSGDQQLTRLTDYGLPSYISSDEIVNQLERGTEGNRKVWENFDQLKHEIRCKQVFHGYKEAIPWMKHFIPTYKKIEDRPFIHDYSASNPSWVSQVYRTRYKEPFYKGGKVKERVPGYCDRILYHSLPRLPNREQLVPEHLKIIRYISDEIDESTESSLSSCTLEDNEKSSITVKKKDLNNEDQDDFKTVDEKDISKGEVDREPTSKTGAHVNSSEEVASKGQGRQVEEISQVDNYRPMNDGEVFSISDHSPVYGTFNLNLKQAKKYTKKNLPTSGNHKDKENGKEISNKTSRTPRNDNEPVKERTPGNKDFSSSKNENSNPKSQPLFRVDIEDFKVTKGSNDSTFLDKRPNIVNIIFPGPYENIEPFSFYDFYIKYDSASTPSASTSSLNESLQKESLTAGKNIENVKESQGLPNSEHTGDRRLTDTANISPSSMATISPGLLGLSDFDFLCPIPLDEWIPDISATGTSCVAYICRSNRRRKIQGNQQLEKLELSDGDKVKGSHDDELPKRDSYGNCFPRISLLCTHSSKNFISRIHSSPTSLNSSLIKHTLTENMLFSTPLHVMIIVEIPIQYLLGHRESHSESDDEKDKSDEENDSWISPLKSPPKDNHISNSQFDYYRQKGIDKIQAKCSFNIQRLLTLRDKHTARQQQNSAVNGKTKLEVLMQGDLFDEGLPLYDTERNRLKLKVLFVM